MDRLTPASVALASRSPWTGSLWPHDREKAVARLQQGTKVTGEWMVLAAPGNGLSLAAAVQRSPLPSLPGPVSQVLELCSCPV